MEERELLNLPSGLQLLVLIVRHRILNECSSFQVVVVSMYLSRHFQVMRRVWVIGCLSFLIVVMYRYFEHWAKLPVSSWGQVSVVRSDWPNLSACASHEESRFWLHRRYLTVSGLPFFCADPHQAWQTLDWYWNKNQSCSWRRMTPWSSFCM